MCPNCNVGTQQLNRFDVQLDMCPQCRGVWLDRGELEKVLEHERAAAGDGSAPWAKRDGVQDRHDVRERDRRGDDDHYRDDRRHKRRPSIFDIFD